MGPPVLVEVIAVTDIGHSAFSLQNTRQARLDKADLAGLAAQKRERDGQQGVGEGEPQGDEEDEGPIPKYPRGMLRFELSDGHTVIKAIEYRKIPELVLGELELGYKVRPVLSACRLCLLRRKLKLTTFANELDATQRRRRP